MIQFFFHNALHVVKSLLLKQKKLGYNYLIINISRKGNRIFHLLHWHIFFSEGGGNKFICEYNIHSNILFI